jgi:hypothetical protein
MSMTEKQTKTLQALDAWYNIYIFFVLWNESLDSDGQQFHQYQQNEQVNNLKSLHTNKKTRAYAIGNPDPGLG